MTKKIVTIGGGTGHYTILRGLKNYDAALSAIVSVFDNGGSSGKLREEFVDFGFLAPGDIRNCLLALTDESKLEHMVKLFDYRFRGERRDGLGGHNFGNLAIAVAQDIYGKGEGIKIISGMLGIKDHQVIPVSLDSSNIHARTASGKTLEGQVAVCYPPRDDKIESLWLNPSASVYVEAAKALKSADLIVICPGDLYDSILANFLVNGVNRAIPQNTRTAYVCNLVTKRGTHGFKASDFVREIEKYLGRRIDYVICNTKKPTEKVVDKYKEEDSYFVEPDIEGDRVKKDELLVEHKADSRVIARHDPEKTARVIMSLA